MPLDSPAVQNYRVGMFNNKIYPSTSKRENAPPRINPLVRDRNPFGEHIDRLIQARNDAIRINQEFNGANSTLLQKVIMLYTLFNVLVPENLAGLPPRQLNNWSTPLSPMALSPTGGAKNSTSEVTGGLATLAVSKGETLIRGDNATNSGASVNNTFAYNARANRPAPMPARRIVKRDVRYAARRKNRSLDADTSRSTIQGNQGKTLPMRVKRASSLQEQIMGSLISSVLNPLRFPLCEERAPGNRGTLASAAASDSDIIGPMADESRDTRCKDRNGLTTVLDSISAMRGLAGVMAVGAAWPAAVLADTFILGRRSNAAVTPDEIAKKAVEMEKIAVTAAEKIVAGAASIGNSAVSVAEDVAAGASVIENAAEVAVKEIAMGAAVVQEAAVASAEEIAASAIALGEVATVAAEDILAQATAIKDAVAETAVEFAREDFAAPEDIVDSKSIATAQAETEMFDSAGAEK